MIDHALSFLRSHRVLRLGPAALALAGLLGAAAPASAAVERRMVPVRLPPGLAAPTALAAGDLDGDGVDDLVVAGGDEGGGWVAVLPGNLESLWPGSEEAPRPFLGGARRAFLPAAPAHLAVGDFDADGRLDVAAARRRDRVLHLLPGAGDLRLGGLAVPPAPPARTLATVVGVT